MGGSGKKTHHPTLSQPPKILTATKMAIAEAVANGTAFPKQGVVDEIAALKRGILVKFNKQNASSIQPAWTKPPFKTDWSFLSGTTWIVHPENLPAAELQGNALGTLNQQPTNPPTITPLLDQTVYQITGYKGGYFWGVFGVTLGAPNNAPESACGTLLSPITPYGDLIISTTTSQGNLPVVPPSQNWGTGKMVWMNVDGIDQWTMLNWKVGGYVHWAYMIQVHPGDQYWNNLPWVGTSVTDFLRPCASSIPVVLS